MKATKDNTKSLLALHGWLAVCLGLLLYVVILTGTIAVFERELGVWARPLPAAAQSSYPQGMDALLRELSERIDPAYRDEVFVFPSADGRLRALFHTHGENADGKVEERGVLALIDPSQPAIVSEREGAVDDLFGELENSALVDFLVELHVRLLLPGQWGLFLTGVLGFAMLVAAVTGFVLHRHLFAELFTLRRRGDSLLTARDRHVLAASWNLPFAFLLAFTGSFFSFGGAIGLPAIAYVAFGGDVDSLSEQLLSTPLPENDQPARLVDLDALIQDARQRTGAEPDSMQILHWGRADASVRLSMHSADGRMLPDHIAYAGATGEFLGLKPSLGNAPSFGGDVAGLMSPLHFGNFAGLYSKALWFAFGFAGAYVALTGLSLWTARRRTETGWQWLERATIWVGYGLPLALLGNCLLYFSMDFLGQAAAPWLLEGFALVALVSGVYAFAMPTATQAKRGLLYACAAMLCLLPLWRYFSSAFGWGEAFATAQLQVIGVDLVFLLASACCFLAARRTRSAQENEADNEGAYRPVAAVESP